MEITAPYVGVNITREARIIFVVIGIFYIVMGTCGNLLIIATVLTHKVLRTVHNVYIINLAVADIIILSYVVSCLQVDLVTGTYPVYNEANCVFNAFLIVLAYAVSLITLTVISLNRYLSICHNDMYRHIFTKYTTLLICGLIWVLGCVFTLPPLFGWGRYGYDRKLHYCGYDRTANFNYTLFLLLATIATPTVIILISNICIYKFVRATKLKVRQVGGLRSRPPTAADISLIKSLFTVFVGFAVLMCPYMITTIADTRDTWPAVVHIACSYTSFTNSCINWMVYGLMNKSFRDGYRNVIFTWKKSCSRSRRTAKVAPTTTLRIDTQASDRSKTSITVITTAILVGNIPLSSGSNYSDSGLGH